MAFHLINGRLYEERDDAFHPVTGLQAVPVADYVPPEGSFSAGASQRYLPNDVGDDLDHFDLPSNSEAPGDPLLARDIPPPLPQFQRTPDLATGSGGFAGAPRLPINLTSQTFTPVRPIGAGGSPFSAVSSGGNEMSLGPVAARPNAMTFAKLVASAPRRPDTWAEYGSSPDLTSQERFGSGAALIGKDFSPPTAGATGEGTPWFGSTNSGSAEPPLLPSTSETLAMMRRPDPHRFPAIVPKAPPPSKSQLVDDKMMNDYLPRVMRAESSNGTDTKNHRSSATANYQFKKGTWPSFYRKVFGQTGETDAQILAKRDDPAIEEKVMRYFTEDDAVALHRNGMPITLQTLYLAHHFGVTGALRLWRAKPDTPVDQILRDSVVKANPEAAKNKTTGKSKTAAELIQWIGEKLADPKPTARGMTHPKAAPAKPQMSPAPSGRVVPHMLIHSGWPDNFDLP